MESVNNCDYFMYWDNSAIMFNSMSTSKTQRKRTQSIPIQASHNHDEDDEIRYPTKDTEPSHVCWNCGRSVRYLVTRDVSPFCASSSCALSFRLKHGMTAQNLEQYVALNYITTTGSTDDYSTCDDDWSDDE